MRKHDRLAGITILYEDCDFLVIDKPAGFLTTHTRVLGRAAREAQLTVENILTDYVRKGQLKSSKRVWLVHRLDRDTSGVMMFAKSQAFADEMRAHWNEITEKVYIARVSGELGADHGVFESYLKEDADGYRVRSVKPQMGGKLARTSWRLLDGGYVEVHLHSGRKNQIRVHFAEAGHPVVGDVKYGGPKASRLCLHSQKLVFKHPKSRKMLEFSSSHLDF